MQDAKRKAERRSLKVSIVLWVVLTGYLFVHTWQWDPTTPFVTADLLALWFVFAFLLGTLASASEWDIVTAERRLPSFGQIVRYGSGFILYILIVLAFYAGVFLAMVFSLEAVLGSPNANAGTGPVTIHPYVGEEVNRYLLLFLFVIVTIAQTFSVIKPLARWFNTNMECWLNLPNQRISSERPDQPTSQELDEEHSATPESRYFRTTVQPSGRVEVASPELEVGRTVDVVVRPIKCRTGREG